MSSLCSPQSGKPLAPSAEGYEPSEPERGKNFSLNNQSEPSALLKSRRGSPRINSCPSASELRINPNTNLGESLDQASSVAELDQITPRAFRIADVCRVTGLGRTTVYKAIKSGALIARRYGRCTIVLAEDLVVFLRNLPTTR
jgi:hypothetical protein